MIKTRILNNNGNFSNCIILTNDNKVFVLCGDYLKVYRAIVKLWNDGESPKSYLSEISRSINRDKSWVMKVVDSLVSNGIVSKYMKDGYKKKAFYRPINSYTETNIYRNKFDIKDYRLIDFALFISTIFISYNSYMNRDILLASIWSVIITIVELILHSK